MHTVCDQATAVQVVAMFHDEDRPCAGIAAMEVRHPHLTAWMSICFEISRSHDHAELVTDDAAGLRVQLQTVTGERTAAL